jgi:alginate O-acetyltransferase complex protein AlgJ
MSPLVDAPNRAIWVFIMLTCLSVDLLRADDPDSTAFARLCAVRAAQADEKKQRAVAGDAPGWLFLTTELKHLGAGEFWNTNPVAPSSDPVAVITAYHQALASLGVRLVVVPVPARAGIYPDKLAADVSPREAFPLAPLFKKLKEAGVCALDLEPIFREARETQKVCCEQDSHWTPWACRLAADAICALPEVREKLPVEEQPPRAGQEISITGDLVDALPGVVSGRETLTVFKAASELVRPDDASSVILLGDSHTAVFSEAGGTIRNHTTGAGLRDHLQARFGFPLAVVTNAGSGVDSARALLARKAAANPDFWSGRKLVIWCFSAREFTQGRWRKVPAK